MNTNNSLKKMLVFIIISLFLGVTISPDITAINHKNNPLSATEQDTSALTFYTFDKTGRKEYNANIQTETAKAISNMFEELKYKMTQDPKNYETQTLKNEFIDLLSISGLVPKDISEEYINSLLNPGWLKWMGKNPNTGKEGLFQRSFESNTPLINKISPTSYPQRASALFCSIASGGNGLIMPLIMLPRPRAIAIWTANSASTTVGKMLKEGGFLASGAQRGITVGFIGIGLTFSFPTGNVYGFVGYALFTAVNAENIQSYPPNREPIISNENPLEGAEDIPVSLSELSFGISDPDGDRMSYTVTTEPNVGSGQGGGYDGIYTVPINNLENDKFYKWTVKISDGNSLIQKTFGFITERTPPFDPFDKGWHYRKKITVNHSQVAEGLTNFPVLISTIDSDLRVKAQADGDDILFMDDSGVANKLYHEIESYDSSSGELLAWVNVTNLSSTADTVFYMYYGNPSCSNQQFPKKTWDSNYIHVWHLGDSLSDSIGTNDGNNYGTSAVTGKIGKSRDFVKSESNYIDFGDMAQPGDGSTFTWTFESWVKPKSNSDDYPIATKYDTSGTDYCSYVISIEPDGKFESEANEAYDQYSYNTTNNPVVIFDDWNYLVSTFNLNGKNQMNCFVNGTEVPSTNTKNTNVRWLGDIPVTDDVGRIRYETSTGYCDAYIDEIRWSKVVRSDEWISTSYNTMNDPSIFFSVGPEETP